MQLTVRFFASLVEQTGCTTEVVELPAGADVATLWRELERRHPGLAELRYRPMAACDCVYVKWDATLQDVGEVAFLPPVSGGCA